MFYINHNMQKMIILLKIHTIVKENYLEKIEFFKCILSKCKLGPFLYSFVSQVLKFQMLKLDEKEVYPNRITDEFTKKSKEYQVPYRYI